MQANRWVQPRALIRTVGRKINMIDGPFADMPSAYMLSSHALPGACFNKAALTQAAYCSSQGAHKHAHMQQEIDWVRANMCCVIFLTQRLSAKFASICSRAARPSQIICYDM